MSDRYADLEGAILHFVLERAGEDKGLAVVATAAALDDIIRAYCPDDTERRRFLQVAIETITKLQELPLQPAVKH
jgi:hypothetical protein